EHDVVGVAPLQEGGKKAGRRLDESALTLDRLDDQGGEVVGTNMRLDVLDRTVGGLRSGDGVPVAQRVGQRGAVHGGGEGAEAMLVGHVFSGQSHREVGPAVIRVVEGDDAGLLGVGAGNLDRVL